MKKTILFLLVCSSFVFAAGGDTLKFTTAVKTLADGQPFYASLHWSPLRDTIARVVNGRLGNVNLSSTANIDPAKLDTTKLLVGFPSFRSDTIAAMTGTFISTVSADSIYSTKSRSVKSTFDSVKVGSGSWLTMYKDTSFACTLFGVTTTVTGTARAIVIGKCVSLWVPVLTGTSNSVNCNIYGIPTSILPSTATSTFVTGMGVNNGTFSSITYGNNSAGAINALLNNLSSNWTASGTKTVGSFTLTYMLQ